MAVRSDFRPSPGMLQAIYRVRGQAQSIEERARAIAVEQSVEMPVSAITDEFVRSQIIGRVLEISELDSGLFEVTVALAAATVGADPGQLVNMLFGNTSMHEDVVLHDVKLPSELARAFGGPRHGVQGLRRRVRASARALTCSALKPQGLPAKQLGELARQFAQGGIDYIKDDHSLADQSYAPFAARLDAIGTALAGLVSSGPPTRYVPNLSGSLDEMHAQIALALKAGIDAFLIAPMIAGVANFHRLVREHPTVAFLTHPSMAGAARIRPALLFGKLFRLFGADAVVFPHHGGRFGYSLATCAELARAAAQNCHGVKPCLPVPAGGMTTARVAEILDFYGPDIMLLIGGDLLAAGERLAEETAAFVSAIKNHRYGQDHAQRQDDDSPHGP